MSFSPHCPICSSVDLEELLEMSDVPVLSNQLYRNRPDALSAAKAGIELCFCRSCGHVFNRIFESGLVQYGVEYENSLHCSQHFQHYADNLAAHLCERYGLNDKNVVEIGCGNGDFLRSLCRRGGNRGLGFDPSHKSNPNDVLDRVTIVAGTYEGQLRNERVDFLCCRHCLEHIEDPVAFLCRIRENLADSPEAQVFFEVPSGDYMLREGGIWDVLYEHCGYFSAASLEKTFLKAGFSVNQIEETYDGQFLTIHANTNGAVSGTQNEPMAQVVDLYKNASQFGNLCDERIAHWNELVLDLQQRGKKIVPWGAGSKGTMFLNVVARARELSFIVDINPKKQGCFVAGRGQQIVSPEALKEISPDMVIVMNPAYISEIRETLQKLALAPDCLSAY